MATYDTATMKQDAVLKVDVLANDTDPNGDTLSIASATVVSGSADVTVVKGKISVDYTGAELWLDETAEITVHYVVTDGTYSSTGILTVDVTDGYNRMTADGSKGNFTGSTGRDYMLGGAGRDSFYGDAGSDIIVDGADLHGKQSNDFLYGGDGDDILIAGGGDNRLVGGGGDDILVGGAGADTLVGEEGNDILIDGAGNDAIIGGKGRDISYDGAGNDQYVSDGVDGADTFYFFLGGGKNKIAVFDSKDLLRIDADAAVGMQITRESNDPYYLVKFELADGGQILVIFEDKAAAKGSDWYEIGDYSVPTDPHGLY